MFGISLPTVLTVGTSLAGMGAGMAGSGGNGPSKEDAMWNNYLRAQQMGLMGWNNKLLKDARQVYKNPEAWQPYSGDRVAPLNYAQQGAFDIVRETARNSQKAIAPARNVINGTLNGDYLNNLGTANPYLGAGPSTSNGYIGGEPDVTNTFIGKFADYRNPWEGAQPDTTNSYEGMTTDKVFNPMLGMDNPYLTNAINNSANDTIRNYQKAVAPGTDAAFARAGAFGGSAWGEQTAENQRNLSDVLSKQATAARMNDYQTQQDLMNRNAQFETGINQSDLARNAALAGNQISNDLNAWQANAGLNQGATQINQNTWQSNLGAKQAENALRSQNWQANLGATQNQNELANSQWATNAGLYNTNYNNERDRQMNAVPQSMNLANFGYTAANNMLNIGNIQQQQEQNKINSLMDYYREKQDAYRAPIDWMTGKYSNAMGTYLQPSGTTPQAPSTNPIAAGIGGAIGGWNLGNSIYNTVSGSMKPGIAGNSGSFSNSTALGNGVGGGGSPWGFNNQFPGLGGNQRY